MGFLLSNTQHTQKFPPAAGPKSELPPNLILRIRLLGYHEAGGVDRLDIILILIQILTNCTRSIYGSIFIMLIIQSHTYNVCSSLRIHGIVSEN